MTISNIARELEKRLAMRVKSRFRHTIVTSEKDKKERAVKSTAMGAVIITAPKE